MQNIKRWISLALVVCLLAMLPAAALAEDTETGTKRGTSTTGTGT